MLGINFIKVQPTTYLLQYQNGKVRREGAGLAFYYFAPSTLLVAVPVTSADVPFIFNEGTPDFQLITIQGQVTYRIADPKKTAQYLDFSLDATGRKYFSQDPEKLPMRVINQIQVLMRTELARLPLREALGASDALVQKVMTGVRSSEALTALGVEVISLSILSIKPTPETSRALEAEVRESLLKNADEAIYARRNSAVEQERSIRENELNTELAVETKKRQIRETQMDAELSVQQKQQELQRKATLAQIEVNEKNAEAQRDLQRKGTLAQIDLNDKNADAIHALGVKEVTARIEQREKEMTAGIALEEKNRTLADLTAQSAKLDADAKAYAIAAVMKAYESVDPKILQALASAGMDSSRLIAQAFRELAEGAGKIGQLNISPDLLRELLNKNGE